MARECGSCGGGNRTNNFRVGADGAAATQAGAESEYEVLNGAGQPTGRKFSSLIAATGYANRIGGSTRPA